MATIYDKLTSGTSGLQIDRSVILDPREALIYPFDLGSDWSELRLGLTLSVTRNTGPNITPITEAIGSLNIKNSILVGFIGWTGDLNGFYDLPSASGVTNGSNFFGGSSFAVDGGSTPQTDLAIGSSYWGIPPNGAGSANGKCKPMMITSSGRSFNSAANNSNAMLRFSSGTDLSSPTGTVLFCAENTFRLLITGNIYNISYPNPNNAGFGRVVSTPTVDNLRRTMAILEPTNQTSSTGYLTHDNTAGGIPELKPKGIIIYCPLYNNQIRIHAIAVERYG